MKFTKNNKNCGRFIQSLSFFYSVAKAKTHQNACFYIAIEMGRSKMSNSNIYPSSFGVRKSTSKSHKMLRTLEITEIRKMV